MRAQLYEKYYKRGISHYLYKHVLGLHKPDKAIKRFYYVVIASMMAVGLLISG